MKNTRSTILPFTLGAMFVALSLGACGPSGDSASSGTGGSDAAAGASAQKAPGEVDKTVEITANDQMKFNIDSFTVSKGSTVKIHLKNVGSMPEMSMGHNVVILQPNTDLKAFVEAAAQAPANDYIPEAMTDAIVAHTEMTGGGEEATVTFRVPDQTGNYPFVCSFPGHFQVGMKGMMLVL